MTDLTTGGMVYIIMTLCSYISHLVCNNMNCTKGTNPAQDIIYNRLHDLYCPVSYRYTHAMMQPICMVEISEKHADNKSILNRGI